MTTWICLLRGINVGGNNLLPMNDLSRLLESIRLTNVQTYIQSGNVVFNSKSKSSRSLSKRIGDEIEGQFGFRPQLMLLEKQELLLAVDSNPFSEAATDPKTLSFFFLAESPAQPDLSAMDDVKSASEQYQLTERVFYLYAPDGFGRSKLAAKVEKFLGVSATARNLRTVEKLVSMVGKAGG